MQLQLLLSQHGNLKNGSQLQLPDASDGQSKLQEILYSNNLDESQLKQAVNLLAAQSVGWAGQHIPKLEGKVNQPQQQMRNKQRGSQKLQNGQAQRNGKQNGNQFQRQNYRHVNESMIHDLVLRIRRLGQHERAEDLHQLTDFLLWADSRAVSSLLRGLNKQNVTSRAVKIFDWMRQAKRGDRLYELCDVFTYTAAISICVGQQELKRALELSQEMQQRNIEKNVYTFTALMNVCIKCGQLQLALDVYQEMKKSNCPLNVVTYNTLIDVYGKIGRWEDALKVLQEMQSQGVEPVTRTYNTLMIACNTSNNWQETLRIYNKLIAARHQPNTTTFNALITAHSKAGKLDKVLDTFNEMIRKGCERSVITYSSLINACEKAGRWELALHIFNEMRREGCAPNLITYNSLISACSQGGQVKSAEELMSQMLREGCKPDVVTYTSMIRTYEKAGDVAGVLKAFNQILSSGLQPDAIAYLAVLEALWESGVHGAQRMACQLYRQALRQGLLVHPHHLVASWLKITISTTSAAVAMLNLGCCLADLRAKALQNGSKVPGTKVLLVVGKVKGKEYGEGLVKEAVANMVAHHHVPLQQDHVASQGGMGEVWEGASEEVTAWLMSDKAVQLVDLFSASTGDDALQEWMCGDMSEEQNVSQRCNFAFHTVCHFENTHCLNLQAMGPVYLSLRPHLIQTSLDVCHSLGLKGYEETLHDGLLLMDRVMSTGIHIDQHLLQSAMLLCVMLALKQAVGNTDNPPGPSQEQLSQLTGLPPLSLQQLELKIRQGLGGDTAAICALRCMKLYLERLGLQMDESNLESHEGIGHLAYHIVTRGLKERSYLNYRPSVVAAAALYLERMQKGLTPFWPQALQHMTSYSHVSTLELSAAIQGAKMWLTNQQVPQSMPLSAPDLISALYGSLSLVNLNDNEGHSL